MLKDADPEYFSGIYIVCGYTDLRYGIDSLAAILERKFHAKLFVPNTLFLFCGRSASKIKGLLWEGDGFLLLYKRVESGHFSWPRNSNDLRSMTAEQFHWLMQGFAIDPIIHDITPDHSSKKFFCAKQRTLLPVSYTSFKVLCTAFEGSFASFLQPSKLYTAFFFLQVSLSFAFLQ